MKYFIAFLLGLTIPLAISLSDLDWLESLANIATVIAVLAVIVAYVDHRNRVEQEDVRVTLQQLRFFRTEIMNRYSKMLTEMQAKDSKFVFPRVGYIEEFTYGWLYDQRREICLKQGNLEEDQNLNKSSTNLLNEMEEFSWQVILYKTIDSRALYAVHEVFVQLVEEFAHNMLLRRIQSEDYYSAIKTIYDSWAPLVERRTVQELVDAAVHSYKNSKKSSARVPD
ncbi:hypothetical protein K2X96_02055 [Patescibacteria group bacterium]|nr:hypothetical protein [Patescibacteria group bacterium]